MSFLRSPRRKYSLVNAVATLAYLVSSSDETTSSSDISCRMRFSFSLYSRNSDSMHDFFLLHLLFADIYNRGDKMTQLYKTFQRLI